MAEQNDDAEKTEDPTQKKLEDALKKGDVAKSQEVSTWFAMLGTGLVVALLAPGAADSLQAALRGYLAHSHQIPVDGGGLSLLWRDTGLRIGAILALPLLLLLALAVAGNVIQHQLVWSAERMKPKLSKISPAAGFKRLFSSESLVNFAKGLVKIVVVSGLMVAVLWPQRNKIDTLIFRETTMLLEEVHLLILQLIAAILAVMTVVAGLDYLWQRKKWFDKQKMTQREVKEEYKQTEGDPLVKGKIRQLRMERSRRRMMAAVPEATVVVTNPTHYAVALKYEQGMQAPICVAKGVDAVALRIREVARDNEVPVVENPPLARALYALIEIDQEVPEEQYRAVAEVIGFVYRMRERRAWRS
ncbi:flagellar biosynthesis protein FlhB [Stappia sp. P2PMeth1]|uniref:flagellar biosynthesis protein FlhB n=1 Tax=Stappia sp. P2PMeth1 TaxID=2003586 RepID=UPI001644CB82|nr:flagellar biosynthesis protein FlhB [Stappia sp. P2PMeth1]